MLDNIVKTQYNRGYIKHLGAFDSITCQLNELFLSRLKLLLIKMHN